MIATAELNYEEAKAQLPEAWQWIQLGRVCEIRMGETLIEKDLTGDGIPVFSANTSVESWGFTSHGRLKFDQSSVVVGARGSIGFPRWPNLPAWTATQTTIVLTCRDSEVLISEWLLRALQRVDFKAMTAQQAIPMMTVGDLELFEIPLPPLAEQKRIAGILKEQMAAVERARRSAEAQLQAAEALPAAHLRTVFSSPEAQSWPKKRLGEICSIIGGSTLPSPTEANDEDRVFCLKVSDLNGPFSDGPWLSGGALQTSRTLAGVRVLEPGAVVFPKRGGAISTNKKRILKTPAVLDPNLMGVQPLEGAGVFASYLHLWFASWNLASLQSGNTVPQINQQDLSPLVLPLPSLSYQQRLASQLSAQMASAERLRQTLAEQLDAINSLPAALLREAFSGRL